jgi:hypothetical protein
MQRSSPSNRTDHRCQPTNRTNNAPPVHLRRPRLHNVHLRWSLRIKRISVISLGLRGDPFSHQRPGPSVFGRSLWWEW